MSSLTVEITEVEAGASSSFWITIPGPEGSALVVSRKMHKVPPHMRLKNQTSNLYDPVIVSYGPYHHGKDHLRQAEDLKGQALDLLFSETGKDKAFFMIYILRRINHIRDCYVGVSVDVYDETKLAEMMLADACLILYIHDAMDGNDEFFDMGYRCLGFAGMRLVVRDLYLLENQIPYWIVQFLDSFRRRRCPSVLTSPLQEPVHLLAILHLTLFRKERQNLEVRQPKPEFKLISWLRWRSRNQKESTTGDNLENISYPHRSVMDLKAKGFRFESSSDLLTDIKFESYCFHGKLQIPSRHITDHFKYFYSNMIAFEVSPAAYTGFAVASYVNFMKSFIESPDDVKELQEKGIFRTTFSNEEVVQMFKEMDTYGLDKRDAFLEVKMRIEKHCSNKAKTWMAELLHTYFRSPWTVLALFAAIVALCLASLQGYYAIRRANKSSS
ncbi:UNVERIFIED_CONTAM: hypothetical protein Sangu_1159500 [Sesamum angustifolium]|uniref:Uncharacterized protein n=1 Tax=Sesamum angustifolium TaxID=2727405 RepID=A0AAW2P2H1_9LAMI